VAKATRGGKSFLLNRDKPGTEAEISGAYDYKDFSEGRAPFIQGRTYKSLVGYIDETGKVAIRLQYQQYNLSYNDDAGSLQRAYGAFSGGLEIVLDTKGQYLSSTKRAKNSSRLHRT